MAQNLRFLNGFTNSRSSGPAPRVQAHGRVSRDDEANVWGAEPMGTNSLFMPRLTESDIKHGEEAHAAMVKKQMAKFGGKAPPKTPDWVGTNQAFFGAHQGGDSSFTHQAKRSHFKKAQQKSGRKMKVARTQSLFRSDDPHMAEYGLEGDNILNEDVLPSDIGSGGPVIGVDGEPSNVDHAWVHVEEPFSFACDETILGCAGGLEVRAGEERGRQAGRVRVRARTLRVRPAYLPVTVAWICPVLCSRACLVVRHSGASVLCSPVARALSLSLSSRPPSRHAASLRCAMYFGQVDPDYANDLKGVDYQ